MACQGGWAATGRSLSSNGEAILFMRYPRLVSWCVIFGLFISVIPVVSAASKSQTIQVVIIIPERPIMPQSSPDDMHLQQVDGLHPSLGNVTTTFRNGDHPTLLYTYTEPN